MTNPGQQPQYGQQPGYPQQPDGQPQYGQQPSYPVQPGYQPYPAMPGADPAAKPRAPRLQAPGGLLAAAGILAVVGAVLPWATFGRLSLRSPAG